MANARTSSRRRQALELRLAGLSFRQIAERLEVSLPSAWKHVQAALEQELEEPSQDVRQTELLRLDRLQRAHWPQALGGSAEATDRVLKIMDRRARLLGLDQLASTRVQGAPEGTLSALDELRARRARRGLA